MNTKQYELPVSELRRTSDPAEFTFQTTSELTLSEEVIGQARGVKSIEFGLSIDHGGYNVFVCGIPGTGKSTIVKSIANRMSAERPTPDDWCYLNSFKNPDCPRAVNLPAGRGREFRDDLERFIAYLTDEMPALPESREYEEQMSCLIEKADQKKDELFSGISRRANDLGFQLKMTGTGVIKLALRQGKPLQQEDLETLDPDERRELETREKTVDAEVRQFLDTARQLDRSAREEVHEINRRAAGFALREPIDRLRIKYGTDGRISEYLEEMEEDILNNLPEFLEESQDSPLQTEGAGRESVLERYRVNLIVDNAETKGAPVVEEVNATYNNLVGRIERKAKFGAFYTNHMMIRPGSVLKANGGFLLLNAFDMLKNPFSWEALKRIIRKREVSIEDAADPSGLSTGGLRPDSIPVSLRVILVGTPRLYHLLYVLDEDFRDLFKVRSDFDTQTQCSSEEKMRYAGFIALLAKNEDLLPFDRSAVAGIVDYAVRLCGKRQKLSLRFSRLSDLAREASYWASRAGKAVVGGEHVEKAIEEKLYRANLIDERVQELIAEGTIMVDVAGRVVGQVNALSLYDFGDFVFGKPSRITARVYLGKAGVIAIEREAKLSGRVYNKAVLLLSGYLGGTYAQDKPLSLSASLAFEQSYGDVEGDSASAAELAALLSGIARVPVPQGVAVTGSINQIGEMQPVGGVNEKIEGFFAVCRNYGLTGEQGVIIPKANVGNLMLGKEVVSAVMARKFRVYAVRTINAALEILTGIPGGVRQPDGAYPEGTLNCLVEKRLREMAKKIRTDDRTEERRDRKEECADRQMKIRKVR